MLTTASLWWLRVLKLNKMGSTISERSLLLIVLNAEMKDQEMVKGVGRNGDL